MSLPVMQLFAVPEIRKRLLVTVGLLLCYRVGFAIPLPGVDYAKLVQDAGGGSGWDHLLSMANILSGAQLERATLFSLGVMPYISASIIFSLLVKVVPALERLSKEGPAGQRKITQYTRLATIPICLFQSLIVVFGVVAKGRLDPAKSILQPGVSDHWLLYVPLIMLSMTAGTMFIVWLGEQITEHGAGNGISLIIMAGITAELGPSLLRMLSAGDDARAVGVYQSLLLFVLAWGIAVVAVVFVTRAQRRIPIRQAKQTRGREVYGGQQHFLPFKVNQAGVMPLIFAAALLSIPAIMGRSFGWHWLDDTFGRLGGFWYVLLFSGLIFFFSFFWISLMYQPSELAKNLKEHGSFVPGTRPGAPTARFLEHTLVRITLAGSAFLTLIAVFPTFLRGSFAGFDETMVYFVSGTSILIVVGVALDLVEKLNAMLIMRRYEGSGLAAPSGWGRR